MKKENKSSEKGHNKNKLKIHEFWAFFFIKKSIKKMMQMLVKQNIGQKRI